MVFTKMPHSFFAQAHQGILINSLLELLTGSQGPCYSGVNFAKKGNLKIHKCKKTWEKNIYIMNLGESDPVISGMAKIKVNA